MNYTKETRSNYFSVLDPDRFENFMDTVATDGSTIRLSTRYDGVKKYQITCSGDILGISNEEGDNSFDLFMAQLRNHIADDDAAIILCTDGIAIATNEQWDFVDYIDLYNAEAGRMLGDSGFDSCFD